VPTQADYQDPILLRVESKLGGSDTFDDEPNPVPGLSFAFAFAFALN
jgi:hypothetical protein